MEKIGLVTPAPGPLKQGLNLFIDIEIASYLCRK